MSLPERRRNFGILVDVIRTNSENVLDGRELSAKALNSRDWIAVLGGAPVGELEVAQIRAAIEGRVRVSVNDVSSAQCELEASARDVEAALLVVGVEHARGAAK